MKRLKPRLRIVNKSTAKNRKAEVVYLHHAQPKQSRMEIIKKLVAEDAAKLDW